MLLIQTIENSPTKPVLLGKYTRGCDDQGLQRFLADCCIYKGPINLERDTILDAIILF